MAQQLEQVCIIEGRSVKTYSLFQTKSGQYYYSHPLASHPDPNLNYRPDYIFFPGLTDKFKLYPRKTRNAFRFVLATSSAVIIDLAGAVNDPPPPIKQLTMIFGIQRVMYVAKNKDTIVVSRTGAALVPPRNIDIRGGVDEVDKMADNIVDEILDLHCNWYANHNI